MSGQQDTQSDAKFDLFADHDRTASGRPWLIRRTDDDVDLKLGQCLGVPDIVARLLSQRGLTNAEAAERFLRPRLRDMLPDPSHLHDLDLAVNRLADAIQARQPIGVIGDYDVDGATSCALLSRYLQALDIDHMVEIPDRFIDGYGPNQALFQRLKDQGCDLVLTLDCGTTAHDAIGQATANGQDVIVIDHHIAPAELPPAYAVINPNRQDQVSELKNCAAVGIVFIFLIGLQRELRQRCQFTSAGEPNLLTFLDLVALGTVCDVVPLVGLNRSLVSQGLKIMANVGNPGIRALAAKSGIKQIKQASDLGFGIGPRINAGGRLGYAALGYRLLSRQDEGDVGAIAEQLHALNAERQKIERRHLDQARPMADRAIARGELAIVVADPGWHKGVIGIVAARLADLYSRPAVVIAIDQDGLGTGSARSRGGFDIGQAVLALRERGMLRAGGGHAMAAGITVEADKIEAVRCALDQMIDAAGLTPQHTPLMLDSACAPGAVNLALAEAVKQLEPFGNGNQEPRLCLRDVVLQPARILKNRHIALSVEGRDCARVDVIGFSLTGTALGEILMQAGQRVDLAGRLRTDAYLGRRSIKLQVDDAQCVG